MEIDVRPVSGATLVIVKGRVVEGSGAEELRDALRSVAESSSGGTIIDCAGVSFFDSAGVGLFVSHYVSVTNRGATVALLNASERVRTVLDLTKLANRFVFATSLEQAIEKVGGVDSEPNSA